MDAVTAADAPGLDAGLWDAAPGEELPPETEERSAAEPPVFELDDEPGVTTEPGSHRAAWLLAGLLVGLMGLIFAVAVLRRL